MTELKIYEYQAKQIKDTFRIVARVLKSQSKKTCLDRDVMLSWKIIENIINEEPDKQAWRS